MRQPNSIRPERFAEVVTDWQRRLMQLDRRNNLLYFRLGKTAVRVVEHTPDSLMQALLSARRGLTFDYAEPRSRRRADRFAEGGDEEDQEPEPEPYVVPGDLRGDCPTLELQRRLGNLRRRAREWQEEQGLNVLFLALGFLHWVDEKGEQATAPLLLLPCRLDRASPRDAFTLWQDDEDLTTNSTLAVKLAEFGIELPEADSGIETAGEYLDTVRGLVKQRPEWEVREDISLATFAYSKLAMWRDLQIIKDNGTDHSIVLTLAGGEPSAQGDSTPSALPFSLPEDLSGARLDDVLDVRDQFAVLSADYSQLLAITRARAGLNLVVHGPPGTGKSQTIANIIATFMAEGKTVLFVSAKTAALDVVKRRLDEKQLGVFCLDLHSERGSKASVYQQLRQSVDDQRVVRRLEFDYAALAERRRQLNLVVRGLHQTREPLGRTVFQVQGRFASIRGVPHVPFGVNSVEELDQARLVSILEAADRVRVRPREFREHWTSHWRVLKKGAPSLEIANKIRSDMQAVAAAAQAVQSAIPGLADALGLPVPETSDGVASLEAVARHMTNAPGMPGFWVQDGVAARLRKTADREAGLQSERSRLMERLQRAFGTPIPEWDFDHLAAEVTVSPEEERSLKTLLGDRWEERVVQEAQPTSRSCRQLVDAISRMRLVGAQLVDFLQASRTETWGALHVLLDIAKTLGRIGPVPPGWVNPQGIKTIADILGRARELAQDLDEREERLFAEFEPGVVDVVDREMLIRYRTDHQSRVRRLLGSRYRTDRKSIHAFRRRPRKTSFTQELQLIEEVLELQRKREMWAQAEAELGPALGSRYVGRSTVWDAVEQDLQDVEGLLGGSAGSRAHLAALLAQADSASQAWELADALGRTSAEVERWLDGYLNPEIAQQVKGDRAALPALKQLTRDATLTVERIEAAATTPLAASLKQIGDLKALQGYLSTGAQLRALEHDHSQSQETLRGEFGVRFKGFDTDWADILASLSWVEELTARVPLGGLTSGLLSHVEEPQAPATYAGVARSTAGVLQQFRSQTEPLSDYDLLAGPWDSWGQAKFDVMKQWSQELIDDADSASDWLLYQAAVEQLDGIVGPSTTERIRSETEESELVPRIIERRVLGAWLDWVYQQEPLLAGFAVSEQEDLITKFKELDERLAVAAQNEIRKRVFTRYPNLNANSVRTNELGILRGELSKQRRQWPVRRLLRTIPRLIQTLKPCFLVSPLAVSQYLPFSEVASETLSSDVVIFDEASQVFPEDAVPAILRGKQSVLAGDQKQLPPTSFWRRSMVEDNDDNDEDDDAPSGELTGRDSILDVAVGLAGRLFNEGHLNVHYRSRDESLIRFSNHLFYGDRLLTFPSPGIRDLWYGVHDIYVPDGRYDAGAARTNRKEAERVVELVFLHMRTRPLGETLGVVALSRPQADLIERLVDERRILERDIDERFKERPEEPFFVKNLENVQGDERDHMIISIGYGPTVESGAVPNRFGPLNIAGGERRLNVVVTRARQRVDLVHSLRASDIHTQQEGARLLRRYLEYADNPSQAFEPQVTVDSSAEPESPFEAAVEHALIGRGHRVARQVGVAGYRIDLAILSEDGTKYDLGIECDGWAYHSAPAARDRDWLRQQVLEGLGWRLHRVWSTAWVRNPEAELARIETALAVARAGLAAGRAEPEEKQAKEEEDLDGPDPPTFVIGPEPAEIRLEQYQEATLPSPARWAELRYETSQTLVGLISRVAEVEGPVHKDVVIERIRQCYGLGRVRGSTRERVEHGIVLAQRDGTVQGDGTFIWLREEQLGRAPRLPVDGNVEHVPLGELRAVTLEVARLMFGVPRSGLVIEVARRMGFNRTGGRITEVLERAIQELLADGLLVESFGMIHAHTCF